MNLLQMKNIGMLKNNPTDDYTTDSAAAGTSLATGKKTKNRRIGADSSGKKTENIIEQLSVKGVNTAIVSNDGIAGATPSAFYAHQVERNMEQEILNDLCNSPANLIIAAKSSLIESENKLAVDIQKNGFTLCNDLQELIKLPTNQRAICFQRDDYQAKKFVIEESFDLLINRISDGKRGFFAMIEGAKIDKGGHANDMKIVVEEYLSFDRTVGKALEFADKNGETLVLVTSDHETGGLTLVDGDYINKTIIGNFSTNDHTGLPILLYAYGPGSQYFRGFAENTSLYHKILNFFGSVN